MGALAALALAVLAPCAGAGWDFSALQARAFARDPELAVAEAGWRTARAEVARVRQYPNPRLKAQGQNSADPSAVGDPSPWVYGAELEFQIFTAGKRRDALRAAADGAEAARLAAVSERWRARRRLRVALVRLDFSGRSAAALGREIEALSDYARTLARRRSAGALPMSEVLQVDLALNQARLALAGALARRDESRLELSFLTGIPQEELSADALAPAFAVFESTAGLAIPAAARLAETAAAGRSDVLAAAANLAAAQAALSRESADRYPDLAAAPGYLWDQGQRKATLSLSLPLPLFNLNGGAIVRARAGRDEARARLAAAKARAAREAELAALR
ncbi:MAG: TolC family protein, partial [Elusimicrobia bacterium]|nr:TolC family protein [Elusimicrobiota bacterium]